MATTTAVLGGIGAGVNAIQGISSSQRAKSEGTRAARQAEQQHEAMQNLIMGTGDTQGLLPSMQEGLQGAIGNLGDITARGSQDLNRLAEQLGGINPQYNFSEFQFDSAPTTGGFEFSTGPALANYQFQGPNTGTSYDFSTGQNLMNQTMDAFRTQEAGVRANALDQLARQSAADMGGLDAALAGRGLARGSGVATGALADLAGQQGAQMAALERDLATLGSQTALQGAQFDVNRMLQEQQLGSSYNLGERQFLTGAQQQQQAMESQYGLSRDQLASQNWQADQSLRSQYSLAQDQLRSQNWATDQQMRSNYDLNRQGMESQYGLNQAQLLQQGIGLQGDLINSGIANQIQAGLGVGNLYGGMLSPLLSTLLGMQQQTGQNVANAGAGAGANPAGTSLMEFASSLPEKNNGPRVVGTSGRVSF